MILTDERLEKLAERYEDIPAIIRKTHNITFEDFLNISELGLKGAFLQNLIHKGNIIAQYLN